MKNLKEQAIELIEKLDPRQLQEVVEDIKGRIDFQEWGKQVDKAAGKSVSKKAKSGQEDEISRLIEVNHLNGEIIRKSNVVSFVQRTGDESGIVLAFKDGEYFASYYDFNKHTWRGSLLGYKSLKQAINSLIETLRSEIPVYRKINSKDKRSGDCRVLKKALSFMESLKF